MDKNIPNQLPVEQTITQQLDNTPAISAGIWQNPQNFSQISEITSSQPNQAVDSLPVMNFSVGESSEDPPLSRRELRGLKNLQRAEDRSDDALQELRQATREIFAGGPGADKDGLRDQKDALHDLRVAERSFRKAAKQLGIRDDDDIEDGLKELKEAKRDLKRAIRSERNLNQTGALRHSRDAISGLNSALDKLDEGFFPTDTADTSTGV